MTAHTDSPTLDSLRTLYRSMLLPAFALLVLALMWSAVVYQVRQEKRSARFEAVLHSQSLAQTLAEHGMPAMKASFYPLDRSADVFNWEAI